MRNAEFLVIVLVFGMLGLGLAFTVGVLQIMLHQNYVYFFEAVGGIMLLGVALFMPLRRMWKAGVL